MKNSQLPSFQALQLNRLLLLGFLQIRLDHEQSLSPPHSSKRENPSLSAVADFSGSPSWSDGDGLGKFYGQAERAISTGQLRVLLRFHLPPIKVVVFDRSS